MTKVLDKSISRRRAMGGMAAATAATVALPGVARALEGTGNLRVFRGRYVFHGDRMVDGYFLSRPGSDKLDTVVLLHGPNGLDAATLASARRHAASGKLVVLPDLAATYRGLDALAGRDAHIADLRGAAASFGRHGRSNGKVEVMAA